MKSAGLLTSKNNINLKKYENHVTGTLIASAALGEDISRQFTPSLHNQFSLVIECSKSE